MTFKFEHTPGPWLTDPIASPDGIYCDDRTGSVVARVSGIGFEYAPRPSFERQANARLICAAPDLLAAAVAFLEPYKQLDEARVRMICAPHVADHVLAFRKIVEAAR